MKNSEIISNKQTDIIVFSLTKDFKFINNKVKGKLVVYLSKNGIIENNKWNFSKSDHIAINEPIENIEIKNNILRNWLWNWIHVTPQIEHEIPKWVVSRNIIIENNQIWNTEYMWILVDWNWAARSKPIAIENIKIINNKINKTGRSWIYVLASNDWSKIDEILINWNIIEKSGVNNDFGSTWLTSIAIDDWWSMANNEQRSEEVKQNITNLEISDNVINWNNDYWIKIDYPILAENTDESIYKIKIDWNEIDDNIKNNEKERVDKKIYYWNIW